MSYFRDAQFIDRVAVFLAFTLGISIPLRASGVATQQAAIGLAFVLVLVVLALVPSARCRAKQALFSRLGAIVAFLFVAWGVGIFFSFDPWGSLKFYARTGGFILAAVLIWSALSTYPSSQGVMWKALIASTLVLASLVVLSLNGVPLILSALKGQVLDREVPDQAFKAFAATTMCLIPVIIWAGRKLGGAWRWAGYAFVLLAIIIMVQTFNRAALAGTAVMALVFAIRALTMRKKYVIPAVLMALSFIVVAVSWTVSIEIENIRQQEGYVHMAVMTDMYLPQWLVDPHRQYIWKFVFGQFWEHPWFGVGIDQINRVQGANLKIPQMDGTAPWVPSHPHNWVLEVLAETGVVGLVPLIIALGLAAWGMFNRYRKTHDESVFALLVLMFGFWSSALFNFSFWATWWQLTFVILFAMLTSAREQQECIG